MFIRLCEFMFGSPLLQLTTLPGLMAIDLVVVEICVFKSSSDLVRSCDQKIFWLLIVCNYPAIFCGCSHCGSGDISYNLSSDFPRLCDQRIMWLYGRKLLIVSNYPARFGDHRHCGGGNIFLIYQDTSHDHVFKVFCDFIGRSSSQ